VTNVALNLGFTYVYCRLFVILHGLSTEIEPWNVLSIEM